jgi:hypothetical protein
MCMGGGGGGGATITMPDTSAYDRQFNLQKAAIEQQMNSGAQLMQSQLQQSLRSKQEVLQQSADARRVLAENTNANAMRMAQLIGTPPPEKSAEAPVVGRNRGTATSKGKGALRIERTTASSTGQGAGLNIT